MDFAVTAEEGCQMACDCYLNFFFDTRCHYYSRKVVKTSAMIRLAYLTGTIRVESIPREQRATSDILN